MSSIRGATLLLLGLAALQCGQARAGSYFDDHAIPEPLAPFEHLIGAWKGQGIPTADRIRGWSERHQWAWAFEKGVPVALSLELTNNKILTKGRLTFDAKTNAYRLEGVGTDEKPAVFAGKLNDAKQVLTLDRTQPLASGASQRVTLRLNSNKIRYTIWDDQKAPGAPQAKRVTEMSMGKEGESFAAGETASSAPKCIVTGGAATLTVSVNGKTFPVCCTGCRDEVQENPEKYEKKLAARMQADPSSPNAKTERSADDGSFDALLGDAKKTKREPSKNKADAPDRTPGATSPKGSSVKSADSKPEPSKSGDKAADLLARGQAMEKSGKPDAALGYYRLILKDHPNSPQAKTAGERMKALGK